MRVGACVFQYFPWFLYLCFFLFLSRFFNAEKTNPFFLAEKPLLYGPDLSLQDAGAACVVCVLGFHRTRCVFCGDMDQF